MNELTTLTNSMPTAYKQMTTDIRKALPAIDRDTANFNKSHSQFMVTTLDITALTPIRSVKHTLAEIARTRGALEEAHVKRAGLDVDGREQEFLLETATGFEKERIEIRILEINYHKKNLDAVAQGAIRKLAHLCKVHENLLKALGKEFITEADYEAEECRYHIMTCLKQALCAARSRGGVIDEGNQIYLFDMGLPASLVQRRILDYLREEDALHAEGKAPTHEMTMQWMEKCADELAGFSEAFAARRGMTIRDDSSIIGADNALSLT